MLQYFPQNSIENAEIGSKGFAHTQGVTARLHQRRCGLSSVDRFIDQRLLAAGQASTG